MNSIKMSNEVLTKMRSNFPSYIILSVIPTNTEGIYNIKIQTIKQVYDNS